ncbi:MAG: PEP-CTERM sorting domain-containing protein [Phycisphaeraceae bacterium]
MFGHQRSAVVMVAGVTSLMGTSRAAIMDFEIAGINNIQGNALSAVAHLSTTDGTVTFVLNVPGITDDALIPHAWFQFGTQTGTNVFPATDIRVTPIPEPASIALFALGALLLSKRRRAR